jgi:hypothetical protein
MPAKSIDEIVVELTRIVDQARANKSRIGYFAAMYRKVTLAIKEAIDAGEFEEAERMTRLDVIFAQRYIDASPSSRLASRRQIHGRSRLTVPVGGDRSSSSTCSVG